MADFWPPHSETEGTGIIAPFFRLQEGVMPYKPVSVFSATLEETALADVLLHVADAADPECARKYRRRKPRTGRNQSGRLK